MAITILGLSSDDKVPGFYGENKFAQGRLSVGAMPVYCLCIGNKTSSGTATADTQIVDIYGADDADNYEGIGSELALMCRAALNIPGVRVKALAVAEASGVAATLTIVIGGTWTTSGQATVRLGGIAIPFSINNGETTAQIATRLNTAINGTPNLFCTSTVSTSTVTVTCRNIGIRGNDWLAGKDLTLAPAGVTVTLTGGTARTGLVPFSGGTGQDTLTNVLSTIFSGQFDYIATAPNDATSIAALKAQILIKQGPTEGRLEHYVTSTNIAALATATSFAQTNMNDPVGRYVYHRNSETHPALISATVAALFAATDGSSPNNNYDGDTLPGIAPQAQQVDWFTHSELKTLLNSGVTPLVTNADGSVSFSCVITSRSLLSGAISDFRCFNHGDSVVPYRIRKEVGALWYSFVQVNPYAGPDPLSTDPLPPTGLAFPRLWQSTVLTAMRDFQRNLWVTAVDANPPFAEWNTDSKRIMLALPVVVQGLNHQAGVSIRQTAL